MQWVMVIVIHTNPRNIAADSVKSVRSKPSYDTVIPEDFISAGPLWN